jgi:hypothetical protein
MKVIKKGNPPKKVPWSKHYVCTGKGNGGRGCGAKLLLEEGDMLRTGCHSYDGSSEYFVSFVCCDCGAMTDVGDYDGPPDKLKKGPGG